jgi:hypothetical protein
MNNWYSKNHKVSPEDYRRARDSLQAIQIKDYYRYKHMKALEFNNNCNKNWGYGQWMNAKNSKD